MGVREKVEVDGEGGGVGVWDKHWDIEGNMDSLEIQHQRPSEVIIIYADTILRLSDLRLIFSSLSHSPGICPV